VHIVDAFLLTDFTSYICSKTPKMVSK